ncbi:hypothetical protein ACEPAH_8984 [Sanghuangporus vaninii]
MPRSKLFSLLSGLTPRSKRNGSMCRHQVQAIQLLDGLPADIILEIFLHLDFTDVLNLAQVSRLFHDAAQSFTVWKNLAYKLMCRGRRISLHDRLSTSALTVEELRHSVLLAVAAEDSWLRPTPMHVARPRPVRLSDVDLDHASYIMKFTSQRHLVLPTKSGELVGWDTKTGASSGKYDMGVDSVLINVQGEYETRSLYWITGKISSDPELERNLHIKILRIQFPEPSSSDPVTFDVLGDLVTPWSLAAELHFLDASQRMICAVFLNEDTGSAGLHVVLDWETGLSYIFDTGIRYEYGRAVIGLHLSADKQSIIVRSEECGTEIRRAYLLSEMRSHASIWNPTRRTAQSLPLVHPAALSLSQWEHEHPSFDFAMAPHTVWLLPQWWPTFPGVPRRTSTIILYLALLEDPDGQTRRFWRAAQHYSEAVESSTADADRVVYESTATWSRRGKIEGGAPCSFARSVVDIGENAVTISLGHHGLPILAQSFNHLGWIEDAIEDESSEHESASTLGKLRPQRLLAKARRRHRRAPKQRTRVLKLVTFPDPGISPVSPKCKLNKRSKKFGRRHDSICECTTLQPVTLDVPSSVLDNVYHMFLDPAAGTITLATIDNELHVYQYGMLAVPPVPEAGPSETDSCFSVKPTAPPSMPVVSL